MFIRTVVQCSRWRCCIVNGLSQTGSGRWHVFRKPRYFHWVAFKKTKPIFCFAFIADIEEAGWIVTWPHILVNWTSQKLPLWFGSSKISPMQSRQVEGNNWDPLINWIPEYFLAFDWKFQQNETNVYSCESIVFSFSFLHSIVRNQSRRCEMTLFNTDQKFSLLLKVTEHQRVDDFRHLRSPPPEMDNAVVRVKLPKLILPRSH